MMKIELGEGFGKKIQAALDKMVSGVNSASSVEVGWNKEATYGADKSGLPVAQVAVTNEYGGTIAIPEHTVSNYRLVNAAGTDFLRGGKFVRRAISNFETTHVVKKRDVTIPPRPFFRQMIAKERSHWSEDLGKYLRKSRYDMVGALDLLGEDVRVSLQQSIIALTEPALAPSTIARKSKGKPSMGAEKPLVDSGVMLGSANYTVK